MGDRKLLDDQVSRLLIKNIGKDFSVAGYEPWEKDTCLLNTDLSTQRHSRLEAHDIRQYNRFILRLTIEILTASYKRK